MGPVSDRDPHGPIDFLFCFVLDVLGLVSIIQPLLALPWFDFGTCGGVEGCGKRVFCGFFRVVRGVERFVRKGSAGCLTGCCEVFILSLLCCTVCGDL